MTAPQEPGSFAEEAARLVAAVQDRLAGSARARPADSGDVWERATATEAEDDDAASPECAVCPLCRSMRRFRTIRPEAVEHVANAATALVAALQDLRREAGGPRDSRGEAGGDGGGVTGAHEEDDRDTSSDGTTWR